MYKELVNINNLNKETTTKVADRGFSKEDSFLRELLTTLPDKHYYECSTGVLNKDNKYQFTVYRAGEFIIAYNYGDVLFVHDSGKEDIYKEHHICNLDYKHSLDIKVFTIFKQIFRMIGYENFSFGHCEYCAAMLDVFWELVFGKPSEIKYCYDILEARIDEAYAYKKIWNNTNIPFNRGVLIFLLIHTSEMDRSKSFSCQFVIDKYEYYLPMILKAEQEVFFTGD